MQKRWKGSRKYEANFERKAYNQRGKYQSCLSWGYLQTLCTWVSVQGTLEMMDTEVKVKIFQGTLPTSRWCLKGYALGITVLGIGFLNAAGMTVWLNSCQWDIGKICWAVSRKTFLPSERKEGVRGFPSSLSFHAALDAVLGRCDVVPRQPSCDHEAVTMLKVAERGICEEPSHLPIQEAPTSDFLLENM